MVGGWNCDNSLKTVHSRMSKVKIHHVEIQKVIRKTVETEKGNRLVCYSEDGGVVLLTVWDLIEGEMVGCEVLEMGRDVRDLVCKGVANLGIVVMTWPEVTMGVVGGRGWGGVEVETGEEEVIGWGGDFLGICKSGVVVKVRKIIYTLISRTINEPPPLIPSSHRSARGSTGLRLGRERRRTKTRSSGTSFDSWIGTRAACPSSEWR